MTAGADHQQRRTGATLRMARLFGSQGWLVVRFSDFHAPGRVREQVGCHGTRGRSYECKNSLLNSPVALERPGSSNAGLSRMHQETVKEVYILRIQSLVYVPKYLI